MRISRYRSRLLLLAAPSVPRATLTPAWSISLHICDPAAQFQVAGWVVGNDNMGVGEDLPFAVIQVNTMGGQCRRLKKAEILEYLGRPAAIVRQAILDFLPRLGDMDLDGTV